MSPIQKSFISAGAIVLACGAIVAGTVSRDRADLHLKTLNPFTGSHTLLASLSNEAPGASATDFYEVVSDLLKRDYVDPITDERKLSTGAVRGMIMSLDNPDCMFLDPGEFKSYSEAQMGKFEGIGVELSLEIPNAKVLAANVPGNSGPETGQLRIEKASPNSAAGAQAVSKIPALVVGVVVPGSPADKAGVKVGDSVQTVDGHWLMNPYDLEKLRRLQEAARTDAKQMPALIEFRKILRKDLSVSMMPLKARDKICMGTTGTLHIDWNRAGTMVQTTISKALTTEEPVEKGKNAIVLHFLPGAAEKLKSMVGSGPITLDLRNNMFGNFAEMKSCLALFAPAGTYGDFANYKSKTAKPFAITDGSKPRELTLIVDGSTAGQAEVFALALKSKGYATLQGPPMSEDKNLIETVKLPDGSGYTLVTGQYEPAPSASRRSA
ncbi:MAG TPA: S41 family peptidase [Fimbriimonadaceae bacterium]|jgi:carboxyl-terminal processing protease